MPGLPALATSLADLEGAPEGGHFYLTATPFSPTWHGSRPSPVLARGTASWLALVRATHSPRRIVRVEVLFTQPGYPAVSLRHRRGRPMEPTTERRVGSLGEAALLCSELSSRTSTIASVRKHSSPLQLQISLDCPRVQ